MLIVASELGAQQSLVSRWASAERTPSAPWRIKIQSKYGIEIGDWDVPADEKRTAAEKEPAA